MSAQQILLGLGAKDYEIERSLRFNDDDSAYLSRTPSSAGNRRTYTISVWAKIIDNGTYRAIIGAGGGTSRDRLQIFNDDKLVFNLNDGSGGDLRTTQLLRDPSAWYHIVVGVDTTQSTASDRIKLYLNGSQVTSFSTENYPSQNYDCKLNNNIETFIGQSSSNNFYFDGYLAEFNFIDGSQLTPSSFGETNSKTGQWVPKKFSGSYGTNGFHLNFSDNSNTTAATLGKDSSGNGNNFTPNNFSVTAGKDDDSMFDTPTNNFPTLSPIDKSLVGTMSNGNLRISYNYKPASKSWRSTMALPSSGKFYWEWENEEASSNPGRWQTGLVRYTDEAGIVDFQGYNDVNYVSVSFGGSTWNGTTQLNPPGSGWPQDGSVSFYSGERAAIAIDCSNGKWWLGVVQTNGSTTWYANDGGTDGDPAGGTNETATLPNFTTATEWMPHIVWHDGGAASSTTFTSNINFGNHSFLGTVPTGFKKLCSANLPEPTIAFPNTHFGTLTWTGNATVRTISDTSKVNFTPDMVWVKCRSATHDHQLTDSVRGTSKALPVNTNGLEVDWDTEYSGNNKGMGDYTNGGFGLDDNGNNARYNANSETYVAWNWKGGGSASSNTNGGITSSVSANTTAGFSILTYTGTGSQTTVGHGLGVKPKVIITKLRDTNTQDWMFYPKQLTGTGATYLKFNEGNAVASDAHTYPDVEPTTTVYTVGGDDGGDGTNGNGKAYVAYCFNEVAGYSKFGKYTGNGNADGPFIYTGFRPAYVIIKNTTAGHQWVIYDSVRQPSNVCGLPLYANNNYVEDTNTSVTPFDIVSNGFKPRSTWNELNQNGSSIIYMAFAESPFKYSRAR